MINSRRDAFARRIVRRNCPLFVMKHPFPVNANGVTRCKRSKNSRRIITLHSSQPSLRAFSVRRRDSIEQVGGLRATRLCHKGDSFPCSFYLRISFFRILADGLRNDDAAAARVSCNFDESRIWQRSPFYSPSWLRNESDVSCFTFLFLFFSIFHRDTFLSLFLSHILRAELRSLATIE